MLFEEISMFKKNYKDVVSFLLEEEKNSKDLFVDLLEDYQIKVLYKLPEIASYVVLNKEEKAGGKEWLVRAQAEGIYLDDVLYSSEDFKNVFKSMFKKEA